ncbi:MAG: amidohydrolase family protein [Acidimicrobiia bacterium]
MLDLLITGATLIDGTGAPGRRADVGVRDGRIVAIGDPGIDEPAARTIDATGLAVAPGLIDVHTHYDAQLCWDPYATPSPLHGTTTVIAGNCGFSLAPVQARDADYLTRLLARVEGMPLESLVEGVPFDWSTFGEYLDRFEGNVGVNVGFFVGHTALRQMVMGDDHERPATPEELEAMIALLHASIEAGGLGYSTSIATTHNDAAGRPVPSRFATLDEHVALSRAAGEHEGTALEVVPSPGSFNAETIEMLASSSAAADRPINWNLMNVSTQLWEACEQRMAASDYAATKGGFVLGLALPNPSALRLTFLSGFIIDVLPVFSQLFELPLDQRKRVLASQEGRWLLRRGVDTPAGKALYYLVDWAGLTISQTFAPANEGCAGRLVGDIAAERGVDPFDCLCDIVVADDLRTLILTPARGADDESWALREKVVRDKRTIVGGSDSGAHLDMLDTFTVPSTLLGPTVRDRKMLTLEEAVHALSGAPAALYGLKDRGTVAIGHYADLLVFDPQRIGPREVALRSDLPAGASRLYGEADGIAHVFVNGVEIVTDNRFTGALPGRVIRSGRDTETVTVAKARALSDAGVL